MEKLISSRLRFVRSLGLAWAMILSVSPLAATVMNIEIDYMEVSGGHSHKPQPAEIAAVVQMFACRGITLNIVVDQSIPHYNVMPRDPNNLNNFFGYSDVPSSFGNLRDLYFNHKGQAGWHYCIFGHQYMADTGATTSSSGLGQNPGTYFVVTLGAFSGQIGTPFDRASTLAHEFGHTLGLVHGAVGKYQPNKPSIMSYFYQLSGVRTALLDAGLSTPQAVLLKEMDYSDGTMCTLNEMLLNEQFGSGMVSVDWDCNGTISGNVSQGIDDAGNWCTDPGSDRNILPDVNEWSIIQDTTASFSARSDTAPPRDVSCVTAEEMKSYQQRFTPNLPQPTLTTEPCISAKMIYLTPGALPAGSGTCSSPYTMLGLAQVLAPSGSHLFCLPGTYTLDAGPVHLNKPMTIFCNIGTAVLKPQ